MTGGHRNGLWLVEDIWGECLRWFINNPNYLELYTLLSRIVIMSCMMVHICNSSPEESEAGGLPWVLGHSDLYSEFQFCLHYIIESHLNTTTTNNNNNKTKQGNKERKYSKLKKKSSQAGCGVFVVLAPKKKTQEDWQFPVNLGYTASSGPASNTRRSSLKQNKTRQHNSTKPNKETQKLLETQKLPVS